jgi:hypothetical protein
VEQSVSHLARILIVLLNKKLFPRGKPGGARFEDTVSVSSIQGISQSIDRVGVCFASGKEVI